MTIRTPSAKNPFTMSAEVKALPLLYRALIRPIREADYKDGNEFLRRFYIGIQDNHNDTADLIASVWDIHDPETCPEDLLQYLKDIVGFDSDYDYLTDRLSTNDLRKLIKLAVPFWKERFSELGIINAIRLLTGRNAVLYNWFHWRAILGEVFLAEEQQGYDFWVIGGLITYFDEYYSQVRMMDDGTLDKQLVLDLVSLQRVSSERIEVALVDFLDQFDLDRSKWETLTGTPASITVDKDFLIPAGTDEKALMASSSFDNYVLMHTFKLGTGSGLLARFYVGPWSPPTMYEVEVRKNDVLLRRWTAGVDVVVSNPTLSFSLFEGLWYKLRVSCVDEGSNNRIKIYIDGNQVINVADPQGPTDGDVVIGSFPNNPAPSDLLVLGRYDDFSGQTFTLDYIRDGGSPTITTNGTPAITASSKFGSGALELHGGGSSENVDYSGANVIDGLVQTGTVEFFVKPNYSGTPSQAQYYYVSCLVHGSSNNLISIYHTGAGALFAVWSDSTGVTIGTILSSGFNPTAGTYYHISFNMDVTAGATRLFLDGTQLSTTNTNTGTRSATSQLLRFGASNTSYAPQPDFTIDSLRIYDTVQRTGTFTPPTAEYSLPFGTGADLNIDNAEVFRVPLRTADITPSGITTSSSW